MFLGRRYRHQEADLVQFIKLNLIGISQRNLELRPQKEQEEKLCWRKE